MTAYSLATLPVEIIIEILKRLDDFSTIAAVALTGHALNNVWRQNVSTISKPLLSRTIRCFEDAEELAAVQELLQNHCKRMRYNARLASRAGDLFLEHLIYHGIEEDAKRILRRPAYLSIDERDRIRHAFYRVLTYVYLADIVPDGKKRQMGLLDTNLPELLYLREIAHWMMDDYYCQFRDKFKSGALYRSFETLDDYPFGQKVHMYDARLKEVEGAWRQKWTSLGAQHDYTWSNGVGGIYYGFLDDYQEDLLEFNPPNDDEARKLTARRNW